MPVKSLKGRGGVINWRGSAIVVHRAVMGYVFHGATRRAFCEFIKPDKIAFILLKPNRLMKAGPERELHGGSFVTGPQKAPRVGLWLKKRQDSKTARWGFGGFGRGMMWLAPLLKKSSHFYPPLPTVWPVEVCKVWYFCTVQNSGVLECREKASWWHIPQA